MQPILAVLQDILKNHKLKIISVPLFAVLFALWLFPWNDLGGKVTEAVYDASQQRIYLTADNFNLSVLPVPGLQASNLKIEFTDPNPSARMAPLPIESLSVRPSLAALLAFRAGASLDGIGIMGGELSFTGATTSSFTTQPPAGFNISSFELRDVSLEKLLDYLAESGKLPQGIPKVGGKLSLSTDGIMINLSGKEQTKGILNVRIANLKTPEQIAVPFGGQMMDMAVPSAKISSAEFVLDLNPTRVRINKGTIGNSKDSISGRLLGDISLVPAPGGGVYVGGMSLCLELSFAPSYWESLLTAVPIVEGMLTPFKRGNGYGMRIEQAPGSAQPALSAGDCALKAG